MIEKTTKTLIEQSLSAISSVNVTVPPAHTVTVAVRTEVVQSVQDIVDKMLTSKENIAYIVVSYPNSDLEWARVAYDEFGMADVDFLVSEQLPGAADWVTINDAVTRTFTVVSTEPRISRISLYTKLTAASTSWLLVDIKDATGKLLFRQRFYSIEHSTTGGWINIDCDLTVRINGGTGNSDPITIFVYEDAFGLNPIGVDLGKNGANPAYRLYTSKKTRLTGKIGRSIVRLNVFCRDKRLGQLPNEAVFVSKSDLLVQLTDTIRKLIWYSWTTIGLNDLRETILNDEEALNTIPFASCVFDAFVDSPDFGTVPTEELTLKEFNIEDIKNV